MELSEISGHGRTPRPQIFEVKISPGERDEGFRERLREAFSDPAKNKRSTSNGTGYMNYVSGDVFEIIIVDDLTLASQPLRPGCSQDLNLKLPTGCIAFVY